MKYHFCDILMQFFGQISAGEPIPDTRPVFCVRRGGDLAQVRRPIRPGLSWTAKTNQHVAATDQRRSSRLVEHDGLFPMMGGLFEGSALRGDDTAGRCAPSERRIDGQCLVERRRRFVSGAGHQVTHADVGQRQAAHAVERPRALEGRQRFRTSSGRGQRDTVRDEHVQSGCDTRVRLQTSDRFLRESGVRQVRAEQCRDVGRGGVQLERAVGGARARA